LSTAVIVVDNHTGAVRVSVGSPAYLDARRAGFVDMTRALRSPGSTLKPLIYGLAFEAGAAHPETIIDDAPTRYDSYAPQNFDGQFLGQLRLREALQLSRNIPAVTLLEDVGPAVLMARLARAGARAELQGTPGLAVGLGGLGINLRDLTATYAALARGGRSVALVTRAADERNAPGGRPVLTPLAAWYVGDILAGVAPPPGAPAGVAYKTGTSYGHRDAWAVGFDGHHTVGVWLGRADGAAMPGTLGANLAAPLLFDVFSALGPVEPLIPPPPEALIVSNAELPRPLRVFRRAGAGEGPRIAFPPDGARVFLMAEPLAARVDQGVPPFTWLANGVPLRIALRDRQAELGAVAPGPLTLSVIDATGASSQVRLTVE
ncbi:MAG: penicillin-binding transpeptidase domain-containing protein, partial [Pseudomonadota bacterium]